MTPTTTHTDLASRLRELSALRALCCRVAGSEGLSLDECNGALIAEADIFLRSLDLQRGHDRPRQMHPRHAAIEERAAVVFSLKRLRENGDLNEGERSGLREVILAIEERHLLLPAIAEAREEMDIAENARRLVARESRYEAGDVQGGSSARPAGRRWATMLRWILAVVGLMGIAAAGMWADWMAQ